MRLVPRGETIASALSAFRSGDFSTCLAIASRLPGVEALALRARCLVRSGDARAALAILDSVDLGELSHRHAAELLTIRFSASITLNDFRGAEEAVIGAKARSYGVGSAELSIELEYYTALFAWSEGRFAEASVGARAALNSDRAIPVWLAEEDTLSPFTVGYWKARALELLGMTAAVHGDFASQASYLTQAFAAYDAAQCVDVYVEATMLHNLAVLVRDLQIPGLESFVRARYAAIAWSDSLAAYRFYILQTLGWCSAMRGDHLGGLREFRRSADFAPNDALKISAVLDRAFLAMELGERYSSAEQLEYACELAARVDWERSGGVDRTVLLDLARSMASQDTPQARRVLDRYQALKTPVNPLMLFSQDRRQRGDECMAVAAVVRAEYQLDRATMLFKEAYEIWTQVGYAWRAAAAALEVYTLTGDTFYLDVVAREAAARPLSWIARRYAAVVLDDPATFARP